MARQYAEEHGLELDEQFTFKHLGVSAYARSYAEHGALGLFFDATKFARCPKAVSSVLLVKDFDLLTRSLPLVAVNLIFEIVRAGITLVRIQDKKSYAEGPSSLGNWKPPAWA